VFEIDLPTEPSSVCLDGYLEEGWFRSGELMTRTPLIPVSGEVHATVPTRVLLEDYVYPKGMRRVLRRNAGRLRSEIGPPRVDAAREALYQATRARFVGYQIESLDEFLHAGPFRELFETREVSVWEGDELVAASYFDVGRESFASLLAIYDQARRRDALGIYTMLLEIGMALEEGRRFYYPGYVLLGSPWLDYKLRLGSVQYRTRRGRWRSARALPKRDPDRERLYQRVEAAEKALARAGLSSRRRIYPLFWIEETGIVAERGWRMVSSPIVLQVGEEPVDAGAWLIEYSLRAGAFVVSRVSICEDLRELVEGAQVPEADDHGYAMVPLSRWGEVFESPSASEAVRWLESHVGR
jgi:arginine-tRNA-protein transferase